MRKTLMTMIAGVFMISMSLSAQNTQQNRRIQDQYNNRQEMRMNAQERAQWLTKELNLTDLQKNQLQALFEKHDAQRTEQMKEMRDSNRFNQMNRDDRRNEMRTMRENEMQKNQAEIEQIIGKENMKKLDSLRESRMQNNRENRIMDNRNDSKINNRSGRMQNNQGNRMMNNRSNTLQNNNQKKNQ